MNSTSCTDILYRYRDNIGQQLWGARKLRMASVSTCIRILIQNQEWCKAHACFSSQKAIVCPGHPCSTKLLEHAVTRLRPGFQDLLPEQQKRLLSQFIDTGQVCDPRLMIGKPRTILLLLECGADAFQPFKRREHSTLLHFIRYGMAIIVFDVRRTVM